ncbi:MAG: winged helix-turn-helix transcriptional regulator [Candidatus Thorarchaeota archaeon]
MEVLDEIDIQILKNLQDDGRISYNTIANELNISPPTVKYRVDKLRRIGLIKKFSVVLDPSKFNKGFFAFILVQAKFKEFEDLLEKLEKFDIVQEIHTSLDTNNIILKLFVEDNEELNNFIINKLSQFEEIEKFQTITILDTIKRNVNPLLSKPGFGIKLLCDYCHAEIKGSPIKRNIDNEDYFFCCKTCDKMFLVRYRKAMKKE